MKKVTYLGLALGLVVATASASYAELYYGAAGNPRGNYGGAGIVHSSHDLSGVSSLDPLADGGDKQKRICVYCHHPHNTVSSKVIGYSPLWNRNTGVGTNVVGQGGAFRAYNNSISSGNSMMGNKSSIQHMMNGEPSFGGVSLLCMSCHDGVTAMNAYSDKNNLTATGVSGFTASSATSYKVTSSAGLANFNRGSATNGGLLQGDMSNHHPVGMDWSVYDQGTVTENEIATRDMKFITQADITAAGAGGLASLTASQTGVNNTRTGVGRTGKAIKEVLYNGKMECVTCHDVHNSGNEAGAERFLWVSDDNSKFCLSCHLK